MDQILNIWSIKSEARSLLIGYRFSDMAHDFAGTLLNELHWLGPVTAASSDDLAVPYPLRSMNLVRAPTQATADTSFEPAWGETGPPNPSWTETEHTQTTRLRCPSSISPSLFTALRGGGGRHPAATTTAWERNRKEEMSYMRGDLLTRTRKLVKGLAKATPVWLKAMEQYAFPSQILLPRCLSPIFICFHCHQAEGKIDWCLHFLSCFLGHRPWRFLVPMGRSRRLRCRRTFLSGGSSRSIRTPFITTPWSIVFTFPFSSYAECVLISWSYA